MANQSLFKYGACSSLRQPDCNSVITFSVSTVVVSVLVSTANNKQTDSVTLFDVYDKIFKKIPETLHRDD